MSADLLEPQFERSSELSDEYRAVATKMAAFQSLAELVGVLPFAEWVPRAPDFVRKQMLMAKVQDEVGHGHVMARVAEDLGLPREQILQDFVEGRTKLLNIFHYRFDSWEEVGPAALLMNSAAIIQFQSLHNGTYLPYGRALKKIEKEEGFHYHHALDLTHQVFTEGSPMQRDRVQAAFETWFPRLVAYFGPPDADNVQQNRAYRLGLKVDSNDELRQRWIAKTVPIFQQIGVEVDKELAEFDAEAGVWRYAPVDWSEIKSIINSGGPMTEQWTASIRKSLENNGRYRRMGFAA